MKNSAFARFGLYSDHVDDLRRLLKPDHTALRARGVIALYVFGSVAREEATPASDVDLLVDYDPNSNFNLIDLAAIRRQLSHRLGVEVDIVTRNGIHRRIRERVLGEAVRVM
ncbi:MAG: nucleotidyltransferase family protein [Hyphomicrobiales bacterium]|nr:nucleotidyltransferase family protein [Hyphomicrobiales bacterium]